VSCWFYINRVGFHSPIKIVSIYFIYVISSGSPGERPLGFQTPDADAWQPSRVTRNAAVPDDRRPLLSDLSADSRKYGQRSINVKVVHYSTSGRR